MDVSIVLRTYNEERYLDELLSAVAAQDTAGLAVEVVLVDSGSTDSTLAIAERHGVRVVHIRKSEFTFGRSLNLGCEAARGRVLVFVSGHCVPVDEHWLARLVAPVLNGVAGYSYGRQVGRDTTKFSEEQVFAKYFPDESHVPQEGFFCNNANAALDRQVWWRLRFDEELTGLEDMELAKRLVDEGGEVAYVADSVVYHIHDETWRQVRNRYEREAIALQHILPELHVGALAAIRYFAAGVSGDLGVARRAGRLLECWRQIFAFRAMQFWGVFRGNLAHRRLSARQREEYFFPVRSRGASANGQAGRPVAVKGAQRAST